MLMLEKVDVEQTGNLCLTVCWFETAEPQGPAYGDPEHTTWSAFTDVFLWRREGEKDGCCFSISTYRLEPDGRRVRRRKANLVARTAIAIDIETNKTTGEIPLDPDETIRRVKTLGLACLFYTTHNHGPGNIRYRMVFPLSEEISPELPAPEVIAEALGLLETLDLSKVGAQSVFFLPSCPNGMLDLSRTVVIPGAPILASWMTNRGLAVLAARQANLDRVATEAQACAAARRDAKIAAGFDPDESLIEKLRLHFDLDSILTAHGYEKAGARYRHPNSMSGSFGGDIKVLGGIERFYSHNGTDPLHAANLPSWCCGVTALDAFDVITILDFRGDRKKALHDLAERFNLNKATERKALAALVFRLIKQQASQETIEAATFAEGNRLGLSQVEVCQVAIWVAGSAITAQKAA